MNLFEPITKIVEAVVNGATKGASFSSMFLTMATTVPSVLSSVKLLAKSGKSPDEIKNMIDDGLFTFDQYTGVEGWKVLPDMSPEQAEIALDHFKEFMRVLLYNYVANIEYHLEKDVALPTAVVRK